MYVNDVKLRKETLMSVYISNIFHFSFISPVEGLCCKPKYRANIIHHFILFSFFIFFYHSSCRKDKFTALIFYNLVLKI